MKKILLLLLVAGMFTNCTENTSNERENVDPLLSGITFYYSTDTMFPEREKVGEPSGIIINSGGELWKFISRFSLSYTEKKMSEPKRVVYKDTWVDTISSIKFSGDYCVFNREECKRIYDIYHIDEITVYTFNEDMRTVNGWEVKVDKDGIYSNYSLDGGLSTRGGLNLKKLFSLNDFQREVKSGFDEKSEKKDSISTLLSNDKYSFVRNENEVIFTSGGSKLYGKLNTTDMTLELTQIAPLKKNLGTFKLKEK